MYIDTFVKMTSVLSLLNFGGGSKINGTLVILVTFISYVKLQPLFVKLCWPPSETALISTAFIMYVVLLESAFF